jgi:two-component system CheB/CheR fusion protein
LRSHHTGRRQIRVAIVDDDAGVRVGLRRLCEVFDLGVSVYASGHEFLASLDHGCPHADCLLIDAHMPTMTGVELQHDLLSRGVQIPTIVFTEEVTTRRGTDAGFGERTCAE